MQLIRCAVVGVFIALYFSADCCCHYIPEKKKSPPTSKDGASALTDRIQICGKALTTLIIEACDGDVGSLNQVSSTGDNIQTKITEDCCDQGCTMDYIEKYCGKNSLFAIKDTRPGKTVSKEIINTSSKNTRADSGPVARSMHKSGSKGHPEVRFRDNNDRKRKSGISRKKKKRSFKRKCAYKSFGHYLLKLDRGDGLRSSSAKVHNNINRSWPSIQIGTVPPEMDKFGGQPIVVVKKNKSNSA